MFEIIVIGAILPIFLVSMLFVGVIIWREIGQPTGELLAKEIRKRRYSIGTLFSGIAVFAITFAILRVLAPDHNVTLVLAAILSFVIALGVVAFIAILQTDLGELYRNRPQIDLNPFADDLEQIFDPRPEITKCEHVAVQEDRCVAEGQREHTTP